MTKETRILNQLEGMWSVEMGRHSNIPDCCVLFWVTVYMPQLAGGNLTYYDKLRHEDFGYVPCPRCLKKRKKVVIHECTLKCIPWLKENGYEIHIPHFRKMDRMRKKERER